jgi:hypothetical protein
MNIECYFWKNLLKLFTQDWRELSEILKSMQLTQRKEHLKFNMTWKFRYKRLTKKQLIVWVKKTSQTHLLTILVIWISDHPLVQISLDPMKSKRDQSLLRIIIVKTMLNLNQGLALDSQQICSNKELCQELWQLVLQQWTNMHLSRSWTNSVLIGRSKLESLRNIASESGIINKRALVVRSWILT